MFSECFLHARMFSKDRVAIFPCQVGLILCSAWYSLKSLNTDNWFNLQHVPKTSKCNQFAYMNGMCVIKDINISLNCIDT